MKKILPVLLLVTLLLTQWIPAEAQNDQVLEEAKTLIQNLDQLEKAGKYEEAIPYAKKLLEIFEKYSQKDDPNIAMFLNRFAMLYLTKGRYAEAEPLLKRSLEINQKSSGKEYPNLAISLHGFSLLYQKTNRFKEAIPYAERFLDIVERSLGKDHPDVTMGLSNLAELYRKTGRFAEAEPLYKRSLETKEKALGRDHPEVAIILNNLALLYEETDRYGEAGLLYKKSLKISEKVLGKDHPEVAISLGNLAWLYANAGNFAEADHLFKRALEIRERTSGKEHPDYAACLNNQALFYMVTDRHAEAEVLAKKSLEINEKVLGKDSLEVGVSLDNLARAYAETGRYDEAEPLLKRSIEIKERLLEEDPAGIRGPLAISLTTSLNNMGAVYTSTERYLEAESLLKRSLDINETIFGKDHLAVARNLENLAFIYGKTAAIYGDTGKYSKVEALLGRALDIRIRVQGKDHPDVGLARNGMAIHYAFTNRHIESHQMFVDAITIAEKKREDIFSVFSERQKLNYVEQNNWSIHGFIMHSALKMQKDNQAIVKSFEAWLKWKGVVTEAQGRYIDALSYSEDMETREKFEELNETRREIAKHQLSRSGKTNLEEYQKKLGELEKTKEVLEAELSMLSKDFAFEKMVGGADIKKITELLLKSGKDSVYIDFARVTLRVWKGEKPLGVRYLVFLLLPSKEPIVKLIDLSDAERVDNHIKAYLEEMRRAKQFRELPRERILKTEAKSLYKLLLKPIEKGIKGKKCLYISPDGNLNLIPFEVLMSPEGKYLTEKYSITYVAAGRDIMRFMDETVAKGEPVIMADPDYDMGLQEKTQTAKAMGFIETRGPAPITRDAKDLRFKRLPDTKQEAEAIENCLKKDQKTNVKNYQDKNAFEEVLFTSKNPRILHLATHGYFLKDEEVKHRPQSGFMFQEGERMVDIGIENPMLRSGIVLAGVNASLKEGKDDGLVSAEKILGLRLKGTDLVVLSACETGTGEVKSGEGVFGLKRAFILSGAKTVVMSLWSIPSKETTELMTDFYSLMAKGKIKAEAFREARLNLMRKKPNPFYWGAFVMVGNPN